MKNLFYTFRKKRNEDLLKSLTHDEKMILREFVLRKKTSLKLRCDDPVVAEMASQKLLINESGYARRADSRFAQYRINKYIARALVPALHLGMSSWPTPEELAALEGKRTTAVKHSENHSRTILAV